MSRPARRDHLLAAAERIVRRDGVGRLTLDAVAVEAGTSKGGLLYHFASRDALITAMVERHASAFSASLEASMAADPEPPGRWTRAYLRSSASPADPGEGDAAATGLLAAMASNPHLADPLREQYAAWREQVADDGLPEADAMIVALAADGLWMADLLGFAAPTGERRRRIIARLLEMAGATRHTNHSGTRAATTDTNRAAAPASPRR
ncbi:MAG TPA: TetR family transcriptional regulator [Candidatus Limnocylindrales bacterium]